MKNSEKTIMSMNTKVQMPSVPGGAEGVLAGRCLFIDAPSDAVGRPCIPQEPPARRFS